MWLCAFNSIIKIYHHIDENAIEISEGWGGRASDKYITKSLAPSRTYYEKIQLRGKEINSTRSIANLRIHVERSCTTKVHNVGNYNRLTWS